MERFNCLAILALLLALTYGQAAAATCNDTLLMTCTIQANLSSLFLFPSSQLSASCNALSSVSTCATTVAGCPAPSPANTPATTIWAGVVALYNDICSTSGQAAYGQYQPCIAQAMVSGAYNNCVSLSGNKFSALLPNVTGNTTATNIITCAMYNDLVGCYVYGVQNTCSASLTASAGNFAQKVYIDAQTPYINLILPGCVLNGKSDVVTINTPGTATTGSAAVSMNVLLLFASLVAFAALM